MLDVLKQKIGHTPSYVHLLSIMQHLLLLPGKHFNFQPHLPKDVTTLELLSVHSNKSLTKNTFWLKIKRKFLPSSFLQSQDYSLFITIKHCSMHWTYFVCLFVCLYGVVDAKRGLNYWRIVDRIIQEISLQQNDGTDPDLAPIDIHVKHIIEKYVSHFYTSIMIYYII